MHSAKDAPAKALLEWYDAHAREMPWRVGPRARKNSVKPDPYKVWLSEIMLQQTQVATVRDYFVKFVSIWPTVQDLATAETEDVMKAWAGLGYYSRARNLKKCAEVVAFELGGAFPTDAKSLQALPGVGPYTSAAIASIAFDEPIAVVDGNVERVFSRFYALSTPLPALKEVVRDQVQELLDPHRPGDFAQATMDLGATICTPRKPACILCPISDYCRARAEGTQAQFPVKAPKKKKPMRKGAAFVVSRKDGSIWLEKRPDTGLLGGMTQVPTTGWSSNQDGSTGLDRSPIKASWRDAGTATHTFTHFHLELVVWHAVSETAPPTEGWWSTPNTLYAEALPTVMKKVIEVAVPTATKRRNQSAG